MATYEWEAIAYPFGSGCGHVLRGEFEETCWMVPNSRAQRLAEIEAVRRDLDPERVELIDVTCTKPDPEGLINVLRG